MQVTGRLAFLALCPFAVQAAPHQSLAVCHLALQTAAAEIAVQEELAREAAAREVLTPHLAGFAQRLRFLKLRCLSVAH